MVLSIALDGFLSFESLIQWIYSHVQNMFTRLKQNDTNIRPIPIQTTSTMMSSTLNNRNPTSSPTLTSMHVLLSATHSSDQNL